MVGEADIQMARELREFIGEGAWCWFGDPRTVYHAGQRRLTLAAWADSDKNIRVASYDHDSKMQTIVTLASNFSSDDHDVPSLHVDHDEHVLVFWSGHAGQTMFYRRTTNPGDVSTWDPQRTVPTNVAGIEGYTYPNPVRLTGENNRLWLFWRGGNFNPTFSTTTDRLNWAPARNLIYVAGQRPYVKYATNGLDTIHFAFTEAHPRSLVTSIYYARYKAGAFYRANESQIATIAQLPLEPAQADKVYDGVASGAKAWTWDIALDADQNPVIVFATFPTDTDHRYHYARWDGSRWLDHEIAHAGGTMSGDHAEPNYSGGINLDQRDPSRVYLSLQKSGHFEVEEWQTGDGGATWAKQPITAGSVTNNYRPQPPRKQLVGQDLDVLWMHGTYPSYIAHQTALWTRVASGVNAATDPAAVAVRGGSGRVDIFAHSARGTLQRKVQTAPGVSGNWIDMGLAPSGQALGNPTVASWAPEHYDVFAVDSATGHLLHKIFDNGSWSDWIDRRLGPSGHAVSSPAAVSWGVDRTDIVARDAVNDDLLHWWYQPGSWRGPERLAASPGGAFVPAIASWGPRRLDIFTITSAGELTQFFFNGTNWLGWVNKGNGPGGAAYIGPAAVASWGDRRLDVFATTTGHRTLAHTWYDAGTWFGPQDLGTGPDHVAVSGMAATSAGNRKLDVYTIDQAQRSLMHTWFDGGWHGPERLDFARSATIVIG
jgi:hypothetical protein